jgi:hypothetical protein
MKHTIRKILKETTEEVKDKHDRKIMQILITAGFDGTSSYNDVLRYLNKNLDMKGMEAFEMYQLLKDNWRSVDAGGELVRTDIRKKRIPTSNNRGRELVQNKIPFKGSNTHANYVKDVYVVYSYNWYPIFVFKDGQWFENENRYSSSTAKQMSQLRPYNQGEIIKTSKSKLEDIIYKK